MKQEKDKLGIEAGDFITSGKAITVTTISMAIWLITGWSFWLVKKIFPAVDYNNYTLGISFILSVLFSVYLVVKIGRGNDPGMKLIIGLLNTLLIFTSANGAQSTYGLLVPLNEDKPKHAEMGFAIPGIDPRPWIQDKFLKGENEKLANENLALLTKSEELMRQNGLLEARMRSLTDSSRSTLKGTGGELRMLRDSVMILKTNLENCTKEKSEILRQMKKQKVRPR